MCGFMCFLILHFACQSVRLFASSRWLVRKLGTLISFHRFIEVPSKSPCIPAYGLCSQIQFGLSFIEVPSKGMCIPSFGISYEGDGILHLDTRVATLDAMKREVKL